MNFKEEAEDILTKIDIVWPSYQARSVVVSHIEYRLRLAYIRGEAAGIKQGSDIAAKIISKG